MPTVDRWRKAPRAPLLPTLGHSGISTVRRPCIRQERPQEREREGALHETQHQTPAPHAQVPPLLRQSRSTLERCARRPSGHISNDKRQRIHVQTPMSWRPIALAAVICVCEWRGKFGNGTGDRSMGSARHKVATQGGGVWGRREWSLNVASAGISGVALGLLWAASAEPLLAAFVGRLWGLHGV